MVSCDNSTHRPAEEIKMQRTTVSLCFALLLAAPLLAEDAPAAPAEPNFLATGGATIQIGQSTSYFKLQVKVVKSGGGWDHNEVTVCRVDNGINVDEATWNPAPIDEGMFWQTSGFGLQIYVGKPDHADVLVATSGGSYGDYMAVMIGLSGDDVLIGSKNEDWILGNEGDDVVLGASYKDHIWGGAGDDALAGEGGDDEIVGGSEGDNGSFDALPPGTSAPPGNGLVGGDGNDKIWGEGGRDTLWGDADDDSLIGGPASDTLDGGEGLDKLWGGAGHDGLDGGAGNDVLYGEDGSDACYGGADADHVYAGTGDDAPCGPHCGAGLPKAVGFRGQTATSAPGRKPPPQEGRGRPDAGETDTQGGGGYAASRHTALCTDAASARCRIGEENAVRGYIGFIRNLRSDNGPEWMESWENFVESFNARLRDELLEQELFTMSFNSGAGRRHRERHDFLR
jgi:hypothetical protein